MKRLSVIIPVYNVEAYLEKCLRSICSQDITPDEYEVICINDGSPDNSLELLLRLQKEYSHIQIIDQRNQGVSRARNNGINRAEGRYILFIDPDDSAEPGSFKRILEKAEIYEAHISFLGFTVLNKDGTLRKKVYNEKHSSGIYSGVTAYSLARGKGQTDPDRIWAVLINRELLNRHGLRFLPGVPYLEDGELITRILCLSERCIFDGRPFYIRTTRTGSATNSNLFNLSRATEGFFLSAVNLKQFQKENSLNYYQTRFLNQPICKYVILTIDSVKTPFNINRIKEMVERLSEAGFRRLDLSGTDTEFYLLGWFYNRSIYLLLCYQLLIRVARSLKMRLFGRFV